MQSKNKFLIAKEENDAQIEDTKKRGLKNEIQKSAKAWSARVDDMEREESVQGRK